MPMLFFKPKTKKISRKQICLLNKQIFKQICFLRLLVCYLRPIMLMKPAATRPTLKLRPVSKDKDQDQNQE